MARGHRKLAAERARLELGAVVRERGELVAVHALHEPAEEHGGGGEKEDGPQEMDVHHAGEHCDLHAHERRRHCAAAGLSEWAQQMAQGFISKQRTRTPCCN